MQIRPVMPTDYPIMAEILDTSWPYSVHTAKQMEEENEVVRKNGPGQMQWYVAEQKGQVIGVALYDQPLRFYQPGKFRVNIAVAAQHRRQGIASALYTHLMSELGRIGAQEVWIKLQEEMIPGIRFVHAHNFHEEVQIWELLRDVTTFDPSLYASEVNDLQRQGIAIHTLQELQGDSHCHQKLYELLVQVCQDLPASEYWHKPTYEEFLGELARLSFQAYFIAHAGETYLGISYFSQTHPPSSWKIGLTGVIRAYRRRGIALALKVRGMAYAQQQGCRLLGTGVNSTNQGSLALNERLGFVRQEIWLVFHKKLVASL